MSNAELFGFFKKAAKLTKDPNNGCRIVESQRHFALSPRYLGRLKKGAMEILESEIGRYSESLRAVPLAYSNLQLLQKAGTIMDDQPFLHFNVSFKAVVFQPTIGSALKCVVNEFAGDHISCLVHNWFNLSLPLSDTQMEDNYHKGSKVMVRITRIQAKNGILAIQATPAGDSVSELGYAAVSTPIVPKVEPASHQEAGSTQTDGRIPQKQKHDSGFISDQDERMGLTLESQSSETDRKDGRKKKKKKKKKESKDGGETEAPDIIVKEEPEWTAEESSTFEHDRNAGRDVPAGLSKEQENDSGKKKKKKRKHEKDEKLPTEKLIVVKIEKEDVEELVQDSDHQRKKKKNKKAKQKGWDGEQFHVKEELKVEVDQLTGAGNGNMMKEQPLAMNNGVGTFDIERVTVGGAWHSEFRDTEKKKRKKIKMEHVDQAEELTDALGTGAGTHNHENFMNNSNVKRKTLQRKHGSVSNDISGSGDHIARTTQGDVYGTVGSDFAPPKKKKKKNLIKQKIE